MPTRLLIIGGVAGGATAAARARRIDESAEIILFERGEYISFANCGLPYYIGGTITERDELLLTTPKAFRARYNIDVRVFSEVVEIDAAARQIHIKDQRTGEIYTERYDKLILSPGAEPVRPPLPGIADARVFNLRNLPDTDKIKAFVDSSRPASAVVVGGGFIGLEMAENLAHQGIKVTILEMLDQVMAPLDYEMAVLVHDYLEEKGLTCELGNGVKSFSQKNNGLQVETTNDTTIDCDLAILSVGVRPENRLARKAGLAIGPLGGIQVDNSLRTSDPNIYAVGDAVEVTDFISGRPVLIPLAGPANKQGRIAADNALGRKQVFRGALGTAIVKIFDMTVASTGANEKTLKANAVPYRASYTHSGSHAGYYPGAETMAVKLLFTPGNGKILGAQIVGKVGVDKRIDVLATAIHGNMTVYDLEELELAYAPPYGSAKDPVNMAGFVAANILKGDVDVMDWRAMANLNPDTDVILDLRYKEELEESGKIEGALHIPVDLLRRRLSKLDKNKTYITYCAVGLRSYIAYRILVQNGFRAKVLSGGHTTFLPVSSVPAMRN